MIIGLCLLYKQCFYSQEAVMRQSRSSLISLVDTPYYHCICRCVRRAFLCGEDPYTGKDFSYRRQWMVDRIREEKNRATQSTLTDNWFMPTI